MSAITAAMVSQLRDQTNEPMMECKKVLIMYDGDMGAALKYLQETPLHIRNRFRLDGPRCRCDVCQYRG